MNTSAIYHRPESEYAYLYTKDILHIRIRTARFDVNRVALIHGDPYLFSIDDWFLEKNFMTKILTTDLFDYWQIQIRAPFRRFQYAFYLEGMNGLEVFYSDQGVFPYTNKVIQTPNFLF